jgi:hypothetical protein
MNKRARVAQIRRTILGRAIEMFVSSDNDKLTFAEAQRLAAKQVAADERLKPRQVRAAQSAPSTSGEGNARETLFKSWPQGSEQDDKWSFCLTAGTLCPANQERQ